MKVYKTVAVLLMLMMPPAAARAFMMDPEGAKLDIGRGKFAQGQRVLGG